MSIDRARIASIVESLVFVSDKPLSFRKIRAILDGVPGKELQEVVDQLAAQYRAGGRGIVLEEVADGYQMRTPPENQEWVKMLVEYKPMRLSRAAMETLAIIAYRQPAAKPDIEAIRGVDSTSAVARLLELGLVKILGRKEIPGRPFIYGTTPEFLETFNLASLGDLPSLKEIEDVNPDEIEAFAERLSEAAGTKVQPDGEVEPAAETAGEELAALEEAGETPSPDDAAPTGEADDEPAAAAPTAAAESPPDGPEKPEGPDDEEGEPA